MDIPLGWQLFIQVILIAVNAIFASAEIAIVSMNELKLEKLAEDGRDASFIALYYGEDVSEEDAQAAGARFQTVCPNAEISVLPGGQPVYYYIISFE